jgi:hypothetical protein
MGMFGSRRPGRADGPGGAAPTWRSDELKRWPTLCEFLSRDSYDDGTARTRGTALLFCDGDRVKVCFNDKDASLVAFASLDSLSGALDAMEEILASDTADWRTVKGQTRGSKK